jgi:hypothetical protein
MTAVWSGCRSGHCLVGTLRTGGTARDATALRGVTGDVGTLVVGGAVLCKHSSAWLDFIPVLLGCERRHHTVGGLGLRDCGVCAVVAVTGCLAGTHCQALGCASVRVHFLRDDVYSGVVGRVAQRR